MYFVTTLDHGFVDLYQFETLEDALAFQEIFLDTDVEATIFKPKNGSTALEEYREATGSV